MHPELRPPRRRHSPSTERRADGKKASNEIESRPFLVPDCRRKRSHVLVRYRLLRLSFPLIECFPGSADSKMPMLLFYAVRGQLAWSHWHATSRSALPASRQASLQYFSLGATSQRQGICAHLVFSRFSICNFLLQINFSVSENFYCVI